MRDGSYTVRSFAVTLPTVSVTQRALSDADVQAVRGFARHWVAKSPELPPEIAAAVMKDPANLVARLVQVAYQHKLDLATARAVVQAHPRDWRAWQLVADAAEGAEQKDARARACAFAETDAVSMPAGACTRAP